MSEAIDLLVLRLEAPLMAFGGPMIDKHGVVSDFPAASMLAGLLGNALGLSHGDHEALARIQDRLRFAVRLDRPGDHIVDYQTVDLGQPFLVGTGWTTRGMIEERGGGSAKEGTHIRFRHYRADALVWVALALSPPDIDPNLDRIESALREPARPLFLGRKCCVPSEPILHGRTQATTLLDAIRAIPLSSISADRSTVSAQWPSDEEEIPSSRLVPIADERDWANQIHTGERIVRRGEIRVEGSK